MSIYTAKVITDSVSLDNIRLLTLELTYPRFIHAELMTHRVFSRNAASSRAIPIEKMIERIVEKPALPARWGSNGKGMQDHGELSPFGIKRAHALWLKGMQQATSLAEEFLALPEVPHKQIVNRVMEPYAHMTTIVTGTNWDNFFALRYHEDADPTFQVLAKAAWEAVAESAPHELLPGEWHLPYVGKDDFYSVYEYALNGMPDGDLDLTALEEAFDETSRRISAARCARVSYLNHDGSRSTIAEDLAMYTRLVETKPVHASPVEHQATPDVMINDTKMWLKPHLHGNFEGWIQHRKLIEGEAVKQSRYFGKRHKAT